jgi:uncharacterized protein YbbC (DUF1343 family)
LQVGLDIFLSGKPGDYGRVGWLPSGSAVTSEGLVWGPEAALEAGFSVVQIFGPEHGPHGAVKEGERFGHGVDDLTNLPVHSLYSSDSDREGEDELVETVRRCDTLVVDLVDIGARYSTYIATTMKLVDAAASADRRVVLLDRPNLLGRRQEGPGITDEQRSLVGALGVPIRHGLTLGELMRWYVRSNAKSVELDVVTVRGWDGAPAGLGNAPYLPPSPNLNCLAAQYLYLGTCLTEGTNFSEGRGTTNPFQVVGAPWMDATAVVSSLRKEDWPGVAFREVRFVPLAQKHAGFVCRGVFLHVTNPDVLRPVELGVRMLALAFATSEKAGLRGGGENARTLDKLWGDVDLGDYLAQGGAGRGPFQVGHEGSFGEEIEPDLLYAD